MTIYLIVGAFTGMISGESLSHGIFVMIVFWVGALFSAGA